MSPPTSILARARRALARLRPGNARPPRDRRRNLVLREAIDMVVAGTDPRIRTVSGYGRKLKPAVERMLGYLDACGNWLAPPTELSARAWGTEPLVRMLFASAEELRAVFGASRELRAFFRDHPDVPEVFVGLGASRRERRAAGATPQTVVSFTDHSVFGVSGSERELRAQVERRGFAFLVGEALERLVAEHIRRHGQESELRLLALRLKALEHKHRAVDTLYEAHGAPDAGLAALRAQAGDGAAALDASLAQPVTIEEYIAHLNAVLSHPELHIAEKRTSLRVNRMNVKVDAPGEPCDQVVFSEITIGERTPRVVVLGRFPRRELPPDE